MIDLSIICIVYIIGTFLAGWWLSNIRTDSEGYGACIGFVGTCILAPLWIPIWILKYRAGYWGDTYDYSYYSWFNHGKGELDENCQNFLADRIFRWIDKNIK